MTEATLDTLAGLPFGQDDPRFVTAVIVLEMAKAFDRSHSPALAAEIQRQLNWLINHADAQATKLDEIRSRVARKQADLLIRHAFAAESP